ncbi:putative single-stranded-DNA-specific exonuclease RecJ [Dictyocaulus viviparus]|uniref:Putative single-stranded-DNA-specific exonuclease RecJ n=1 Tax=Dictyocaulus viviparus TaxID=29172 RepID=A0A0D8X6U6_DICVI|nr:putative single-stranded-DNA-specific exonuclease RecJ [Dictyocaulus viviparus]
MLLDIEKRSMTDALWRLQEADQREILTLTQQFELPEVLARTLFTRGVNIGSVISNGENIAIFGDYDVDGATSSALINRYLRMTSIQSIIYIPHRVDEGYGLNAHALLQLKKKGIELYISIDCGTLAYQPTEDAKNFNLDIIVIDHHLGTEKLPIAAAVVNPNRLDETSPYTNLAAVGVSFLLIVALNKSLRGRGFFTNRKQPDLFSPLDLVALGTVCDVMQITGLNRAFVSQGLRVIYLTAIGIRSIIYIPDRVNEGYGLNAEALLQLKKKGVGPCISVDCGTLAYQPIEDAKNFNLDIIVIDYHLGTEKLPSAAGVVNPSRLDESPPYANLAAVGVSFLLIVALNKSLRGRGFFTNRKQPDLFSPLDLVALGTVCDVMQITGLNRAFVSQGLRVTSARKTSDYVFYSML